MTKKTDHTFPLGVHHRDDVAAKSGRMLRDLNLDDVKSGAVGPDDTSASAETLILQAQFAREAGYNEVAANLTRAAEMTRMPNDEILAIYEALRPGRSTYYQLLSLSQRIASEFAAEETGAYIREAAEAYRDTGLLKMDGDKTS
ncbi:MAG: diol dehydratase small subunit [Rhizobiaceae bacterium]